MRRDDGMHTAEKVLLNVEENDSEALLEALATVVDHLKRSRVDVVRYEQLCSAILETSLTRLVSVLSRKNHGTSLLTQLFLVGDSSTSFNKLCTSLGSETGEIEFVTHVLKCFLDRETGGVNRLRSVLQGMETAKTAAFLVHLPTVIANSLPVLAEGSHASLILEPDDYYRSLSEALCSQLLISDNQKQIALANLLRRIVILKRSDQIIKSCSLHSVEAITSIVLKAPQSSIEALIRCMLCFHSEDAAAQKRIANALPKVLKLSTEAREACINRIAFSRPLLQNQKTSLRRLVDAVSSSSEGSSVLFRAVSVAAETWSNTEFILGADLRLHRQVTRLLLYYLLDAKVCKTISLENSDGFMLEISPGVEQRLGENDLRIRRHGMLIGEAVSRLCNDNANLQFDVNEVEQVIEETQVLMNSDDSGKDESDSDFTELSRQVGTVSARNIVSVEQEMAALSMEKESVGAMVTMSRPRRSTPARTTLSPLLKAELSQEAIESLNKRLARSSDDIGDTTSEWEKEDDWSSVCSWEEAEAMESSIPDGMQLEYKDYLNLQKEMSSPMSLPRLLALLGDANSSGSGAIKITSETVMSALGLVSASCKAAHQSAGLKATAVQLLLEVNRVDVNRYPDEYEEEMRRLRADAMENLVQVDLGKCGIALVEKIICGDCSDIARRLEGLVILSSAVRNVRKRYVAERVQGNTRQKQGLIVRQVGEKIRQKRNLEADDLRTKWDEEGAVQVFFSLADGLVSGGGGSFVDIEGRDSEVWSRGIVTLATVAASCVGVYGGDVRRQVMVLCMGRLARLETDSVMKRAIALALGAVMEAMTDVEVKEELMGSISEIRLMSRAGDNGQEVGQQCYEWLVSATEDSDAMVRRFASMTLAKWAGRVESGL